MGSRNYLSLAKLNRGCSADWSGVGGSYGNYGILATYDAEYRSDVSDSRRGAFPLMQFISFLAIVYFSWILLHESLHYFSCIIPGDRASVLSMLPTPAITCDAMHSRTAVDAFLYSMSPYIAAVLVLLVFSGVRNRFVRLIPYTAFFDLQYNLFFTSLFGGRFGGRENDALSLLEQLNASSPSYPIFRPFFVLSIIFLVGSSLLVFYSGYRHDLTRSRNKRFFSVAVAFYALFYAASLAALYLP